MEVIHIKRFDKIEELDVEILEYLEDNPLLNENHEFLLHGIFKKGGNVSNSHTNIELEHWENLLRTRVASLLFEYGYAMYYFERGIPDEEWFTPPVLKGEDGQKFPLFKNEHYTNYYNFCYFVDNFFLKASTVYETIGHLLYKQFDLPLDEDDWRDQVSFNSAIEKLRRVSPQLYTDLKEVKKSSDFSEGIRMRNDIAHNQPPHGIFIGDTATSELWSYTTSNKIKKIMIGLSASIQQTFIVLKNHLIEQI